MTPRAKAVADGAKFFELAKNLARDRDVAASFPMDAATRTSIVALFDEAISASQDMGRAFLNLAVLGVGRSMPALVEARCKAAAKKLDDALSAEPDLVRHILAARGASA